MQTVEDSRIEELENRLREAEDIIEAIRSGHVDALALKKDGKPAVYTLQSTDYTYRLLIEKIGEGALSITREGLILFCNSCFMEIAGAETNLTGTVLFDLVDKSCVTQFKELIHVAESGQSKGEILLFVNGKKVPVYVSLTSLLADPPAIGIVMTDLTAKKKSQETIERYRYELEHRVQQLYENNKELEQFAHIISHDLKEPLRKISSYGDIMKRGVTSGDSKETILQHLAVVMDASTRMRALIDDLLSYTTNTGIIDPAKMGHVNLNYTILKVELDLELLIAEKEASIIINELPVVRGVQSQLSRLFQNLIMNALKFSRVNAPPEIIISAKFADGEDIGKPGKKFHKISVTDNGIGFDPHQKDRIFVIFQRLHTSKEYSGTGIGLAICKRIAENHLGAITTSSHPGQGSVFNLYLPV